ncbi:MAG TPA: NADH-quinone oxidoreductase subunit C [Candidatus Saccharicenans sp.]|jgi:Ni,Fe-hydrogenase III component G|nr:NADH-quinone oxidoreductase subunit C [Candidatus Saccharicenans sp.]HRD01487.1 NADH-quinone oxidoreductase subunit C [Candidatus Saccharicenans sp.]
MNDQALIDKINEGLKDKVVAITNPAPRRIFFKVTTDNLLTAASWLRQELGITHLSTISGVDLGQSFELLYHFANDYCVLTLRTEIPHEKPVLPSICEVIPGAILYERELQDMFGIVVQNIPDGRPLVLPDDWPAGNYPLRKDWKYERPPEVIPGGKS